MKEEINRLKEKIDIKDEEITNVQKEIGEMQRRFKKDLTKQTRFNAANNSSIIQLRERFDNFNERVRVVNVAIRQFLDAEQKDIDDDPDNLKISVLERNVRKLIHLARTNIENTSSSISEKEAVLNLLRSSSRHKQYTLSEIVQQYVEKQERAKMALASELENLLTAVRGPKSKLVNKSKTDLKYLKSQMAMLREEVEHMKKKIEWKDSQISDLIKEKSPSVDAKLSTSDRSVMFPRLSVSSVQRDSPDSTREIEKVYQHFDRLNTEACSPPPNQSRVRRGSLADVNLESGSSPRMEPKSRRDSKFETSDLDLFSPTVSFRRSITDIGSTSFQSVSTLSNSSMDKTPTLRQLSSMDDKIKLDLKRRRESKLELEADYVREGRRPSLAELITIYESTTDENQTDDTTEQRLPILQET